MGTIYIYNYYNVIVYPYNLCKLALYVLICRTDKCISSWKKVLVLYKFVFLQYCSLQR